MSIVDWFNEFYTRDNKNQTKYGTGILFEKYKNFSGNNISMRSFHSELKSSLGFSVIRRTNGYYIIGIVNKCVPKEDVVVDSIESKMAEMAEKISMLEERIERGAERKRRVMRKFSPETKRRLNSMF